MKITVLCTDQRHPVVPYLLKWQQQMIQQGHEVMLISNKSEIIDGDFLFLVSCSQMISNAERSKFKSVLVLHASDLPKGRGWSPHIWTLISGENVITLCLLEANDPVDSGAVWLKQKIHIEDHMLLSEINHKLFEAELSLMTMAINKLDQIKPIQQDENGRTYWPKRTPEDSRLDPNKTLSEQFNILRLADPERHPAFIDHLGNRYLIKLEKVMPSEKK
jgi:methionyl-tRNA formyltransferase